MSDWTEKHGRANSSYEFQTLVSHIDGLIRGAAHDLIAGRSYDVAHLIMAQLAHVHGLVPKERP